MKALNDAALAPKIDFTKLFGFDRVADQIGALEDSVATAFNKRGEGPPKASMVPNEGLPGFVPTEGPPGKSGAEAAPV